MYYETRVQKASNWPETAGDRPAIMSRREQAMIEGLRGDAAAGILPHYAKRGYYDDGCGKQWISEDGQALAQRRVDAINAHDRHLSTLPRLPDNDALRRRIGD
jgi:hypothetical protein